MKKRIFKMLLIFGGLFMIPIGYINSSLFIQNQEWKYAGGTHIGDWLNENNLEIKDRIIYSYRGKAKIVFSFGSNLVIENIETKEKGFYVNKS